MLQRLKHTAGIHGYTTYKRSAAVRPKNHFGPRIYSEDQFVARLHTPCSCSRYISCSLFPNNINNRAVWCLAQTTSNTETMKYGCAPRHSLLNFSTKQNKMHLEHEPSATSEYDEPGEHSLARYSLNGFPDPAVRMQAQ